MAHVLRDDVGRIGPGEEAPVAVHLAAQLRFEDAEELLEVERVGARGRVRQRDPRERGEALRVPVREPRDERGSPASARIKSSVSSVRPKVRSTRIKIWGCVPNPSVNAPVVADGDGGLDALGVEDLDEVLGEELVPVLLVVGGLGRPAVPEAVGNDDAVAQGLQMGDLAGPVGGGGGEAVDEEDGRLPRRGGGVVVVVVVATLDFHVLELGGVHGCWCYRDRSV